MIKHITPIWTKEDLNNLQFLEDYHKDKSLNETYIAGGHNLENMRIGLLQEHMGVPSWANDVKNNFKLQQMTVTIHKLRPSTYLPIHIDLYGKYKEITGIQNNICRIIVFLEDWQPGHMLDINNIIYNSWKAGDYVSWTDDTPHAAYNFGLVDRYTLQITGGL
jgi:hypothetical protein